MGSNRFGKHFCITTWGESHGIGIGVVIDGVPPGLSIIKEEIEAELLHRAPGRSPYTSPRKEEDAIEILSGVHEGKSTGAPISMLIRNKDVQSAAYQPLKSLFRPGHANVTYLQKYRIFDPKGGSRASARETVARVAAGAVAQKILDLYQIEVVAYLHQVGDIVAPSFEGLWEDVVQSPIFCPDAKTGRAMEQWILKAKKEGDSVGGVVACRAVGVPAGLGDPIYEKLEAELAYAMLSLPASKGFEIGAGFTSVRLRGSQMNDEFFHEGGKIKTKTNRAGGVLGGISNGMPLEVKVAFKPTSTIQKEQQTVDFDGAVVNFKPPANSRHDPCLAIRAVPCVKAMMACVLADRLLAQATMASFLSKDQSFKVPS